MKQVLIFCLLMIPFSLVAQTKATTNPYLPTYLRFPEIPPFAMTTPSGKVFTDKDLKKNKPVMIILFSVDCEHCQHETKEITANIDKFKGSQIVMITPFRHNEMTAFYKGYGINHYSDVITMGTDSTRRIDMFYRLRYFPGIYIYRHNKLVFHHQGTDPVDTLVHYLKGK